MGEARTGGTPPGGVTVIGGSTGTVVRALKLNDDGTISLSADIEIGAVELKDSTTDVRVNVQAANAAVSTASTVVLTQPVDNAGLKGSSVSGYAATGAAASGNPVLIAGWDSANARTLLTDASGELKVSELSAALALADAAAIPTTTKVGAVLMGYNGATVDFLRSTTATGLQQDLKGVAGGAITTVGAGRQEVAVRQSTQDPLDSTGAAAPFKFASISAASSGNNTIVAANATKKFRILNYVLVADGTVTAKFQSGAGGTDLTGAMALIASSGVSFAGSMLSPAFETLATNTLLNISLSGAVGVRGHITYQEF